MRFLLLCIGLVSCGAAHADSSWSDPAVIVPGIFSFLLVIVGFLQVKVYSQQREIMERTLKVSEEASRVALANARIAIGAQLPRLRLQWAKIKMESTVESKEHQKFQFVGAMVSMKNYGGSIAHIESESIELRFGMRLPDEPEYDNAVSVDPETVLESGDARQLQIKSVQMPINEFTAITIEKSWLWVYGFVQYFDYLGNKHIARFGKQMIVTGSGGDGFHFKPVEMNNPKYLESGTDGDT